MSVDPAQQLEALLELADAAGIEVHSLGSGAGAAGELPPTSAVCRVRDAVWVVLCAGDPVERHIDVLSAALREHAADFLEQRFIPPALRARLE